MDWGFIAAFFGVAAIVLFSYGFFRLRGQKYPSQSDNG